MADILSFLPQFANLFAKTPQLSNIKPSEWAEKKVVIPGKGRLNYDYNPYCRKIIDCFAPDHPARNIAWMKGSQITASSGVLMPLLGWIIEINPCNTLLTVGTPELIKPAAEKLDLLIAGAMLQDFIKYAVARKKNNKSGDTDEIKNFIGGYAKIASITNPKSVAQIDLMYMLLDDFEAQRGRSKIAGSFKDLIEMRAASNLNTYKLGMISTPLLKEGSNIEPAYLAGDRERFFVECPCCKKPIIFKWTVKEGDIINTLTEEAAEYNGGIVYERNNHGQVKEKTVGFICYRCAGFFTDKNKQKQLREAYWQPTAVPISPDYYSFHTSSLYAPVGMFDWQYYAKKHSEANPNGQPIDEYKMQVLVNTCWGETYQPQTESPKAMQIMKNMRPYDIGTIPEKQSIADGNGRIVLITCAADMNGKMKGFNSTTNDARLDYEIRGHSESGAIYSIMHGSIGTFKPLGGNEGEDRTIWTYEHNQPNSVWPALDKITQRKFKTDGDIPREMPIWITGLDCGAYATSGAYPYLDKTNSNVVGLKGDKEDQEVLLMKDTKLYKVSLERADNLYILPVNFIKDKQSEYMALNWDPNEPQPPFFMNFPYTGKYICPVKKEFAEKGGYAYDGDYLYTLENFFQHYEAEERKPTEDAKGIKRFRWQKKNSAAQNHMWDCSIYNIALREIALARLAKGFGVKDFTWQEFVAAAINQIRKYEALALAA